MDLIRITAQGEESLSEFYAREAENHRQEGRRLRARVLDTMVDLLEYLRTSVDAPPVYAEASVYELRLIPGDDDTLPTLATVAAAVAGPKNAGFFIAYELPPAEGPWENAWVQGLAIDVPQAAKMIQIALRRNAHAN
ncbi:MAG: hypothetical protein HQ567_22155 [Candidatus Nealsonbacteria bacterium]|nr:hypothetical protein [Candidatus Nealsonbacteria bacterium]